MRLLMLSTNGEPCGIADYNSTLGAAFLGLGHLTDTVRIPRLDSAGLAKACEIFRERLPKFDLGLVQHEWGFFGSNFRQSAQCFAELLKSLGDEPPVAIFIHSGFPVLPRSRTMRFFSKDAKIRAAKRAMVSAINRRARVLVDELAGRSSAGSSRRTEWEARGLGGCRGPFHLTVDCRRDLSGTSRCGKIDGEDNDNIEGDATHSHSQDAPACTRY
jgi:hypothetical protein